MESSSSDQSPVQGPGHQCGRPDLAERLLGGDELSGALGEQLSAHAQTCPSCAVRLSLIQQAERWIADHGTTNPLGVRGTGPCPAAEELYDYGRGPDARALPKAAERRIEAHLVTCEDCRSLVATLASRPPAPLFADPVQGRPRRAAPPAAADGRAGGPDTSLGHGGDETLGTRASPTGDAGRSPQATPAGRPHSTRRPWLLYAAAATLALAGLYGWSHYSRGTQGAERALLASGEGAIAGSIRFPDLDPLRGEFAGDLRAPLGRVLAGAQGGTWKSLRFSVAPMPEAQSYSFQLLRLEPVRAPEDAGRRGNDDQWIVDQAVSETPELVWESEALRRLEPGVYTWKVSALCNGMPFPIGSRTFVVQADPAGLEQLRSFEALAPNEYATAALGWLVERRYFADARAVAEALPPSEARDEFLRRIQGR
jgi:hypothetical protein